MYPTAQRLAKKYAEASVKYPEAKDTFDKLDATTNPKDREIWEKMALKADEDRKIHPQDRRPKFKPSVMDIYDAASSKGMLRAPDDIAGLVGLQNNI